MEFADLYKMIPFNISLLDQIKRLVVIALASDDELLETLVLKGGNAIDLVYYTDSNKLSRTSYDLDYSINGGDFAELEEINSRIEQTLRQTFIENGFELFDYKFFERPKKMHAQLANFWGGYLINFKLLEIKQFNKLGGNKEKASRSAISLKPDNSPKFEIEISKYECVDRKIKAEVDGYQIYVYSPEMIVFEKIRALCQQLPEYAEIVPSHSPRARARDFYDIFLIMDSHEFDIQQPENKQLLVNIFEAKKVPVEFIKNLRHHIAFHKENWQSVIDTLPADDELKDFDFYAHFILSKFEVITFL